MSYSLKTRQLFTVGLLQKKLVFPDSCHESSKRDVNRQNTWLLMRQAQASQMGLNEK